MITGRISLSFKAGFTREELESLLESNGGWKLSLYMPLHKTGRETRQAPILLKDLRERAGIELSLRGVPGDEMEAMLAPIDQILEETDLGLLQGDGLVFFSAKGYSQAFLIPICPAVLCEVDRRVRLEPLMPLIGEDDRFHLLALSLDAVRLFEMDRATIREIPLDGLAINMREALHIEDSEAHLIMHLHAARNGVGVRGAAHYGPGAVKGDMREMKREVFDFFKQIDHGLKPHLRDSRLPLMLAGAEYLHPLYREANSHSMLMQEALPGNPEAGVVPEDLRRKAWTIFSASRQREMREAMARYQELRASGRTAFDITRVIPMALQGRISHLFIRKGYSQRGSFDATEYRAYLAETGDRNAEDLANLACSEALRGGGKVYSLEPEEMPERSDIAALCRY